MKDLDSGSTGLLMRLSAYPPTATPAEVATRVGDERFVVALAALVQSLVVEVEVGRSELLEAQSALTSVLKRMKHQHVNATTAATSANIMERAVHELAEANSQLRCKLISRGRQPSKRMLLNEADRRAELIGERTAERTALDVPPTDWRLRERGGAGAGAGGEAACSELLLVAERDGAAQGRAADGLAVCGASVARPPGPLAPRALIAQLSENERLLKRWEQAGPGEQSCSLAPSPTTASCTAAAAAESGEPISPINQAEMRRDGPRSSRDEPIEPSAPAPPHVALGAHAGVLMPWRGDVGYQSHAVAAAAAVEAVVRAPRHSSRPWSQRVEELSALRPAGREAATAAAAASAAALAVTAGQHRFFVAEARASFDQRAGTYEAPGAAPGHALSPAWRVSDKPRPFSAGFARSCSVGSCLAELRSAASQNHQGHAVGAHGRLGGRGVASGCGSLGMAAGTATIAAPTRAPQVAVLSRTSSAGPRPSTAAARYGGRGGSSSSVHGSVLHDHVAQPVHPGGAVKQQIIPPRPASATSTHSVGPW
jgi:hypothetical protein